MITEKQVKRDIEKYIKQLKSITKNSSKPIVKVGNPNDKHLRTYIKNIYYIKLLFPKTLDIELAHNMDAVNDFINNYKNSKEAIIKIALNKLNNTPKFIIK